MNQELAKTGNDRLGTIASTKALLESKSEEFAKVLAKHIDPGRFVRMAVYCCSRTPKLLDCSKLSFLRAIMDCAAIGLEPDSSCGYVYLIPYGQNVQLVIGYKGLLELVMRSGKVSLVYTEVVREGDRYEVTKGLAPNIEHKPAVDSDAPLVAAYAVARFVDGNCQFETMSKRQIDKIRARSKSANNGPWVTDYEEMARKTVLRRLCKMLPMSAEIRQALEFIDNRDFQGHDNFAGTRESKTLASLDEVLAAPVVEIDPIREPGDEPEEATTT